MSGSDQQLAEIERRKDRWRRAYAGDRSVGHLLVVRYDGDMGDVPPAVVPLASNLQYRIERAWKLYQVQMQRLGWLQDDTIPYLDCLTGTEVFAEAFGCPVHVPKDDMPFARPMVFSAREAEKVAIPDLDAPPLKRAFDMADELVRRAGKGVLVRPVDIQSPMDIAALIWEKGDFFMAMIETSDVVKELASKVHTLLVRFLDEWHRRYGDEHVAHYPDYYMPNGITLSEDEIGAVNNEMFEEFFLPELVMLSQHFGAIGIHCCANSEHQWKSFTKISNLRFLNLKGELAKKAYHFFSSTNIIQQHCQTTEAQWDQVMSEAPNARLFIDVRARNREDALRLVKKYKHV